MTFEFVAMAMVVIAVLAHHGFRLWLKHQASLVTKDTRIAELERWMLEQTDFGQGLQARVDQTIKLLAEDFKRKLIEMEKANADLRKHIDSHVAGTIAQLPNTGGGFNRRG